MNAMKEYLFFRWKYCDIPALESQEINGFAYSFLCEVALARILIDTCGWDAKKYPRSRIPC